MPSWFKFDDNIRNNKKFLRMGRKRIYKVSEADLCELLFERVLGWCSHNLTDGLIPEGTAYELDPTGGTGVAALRANRLILTVDELAKDLAEGGRTLSITSRSTVDLDSIQDRHRTLIVPDYLDWQRSREQVERDREGGRLRQQKKRSAGQGPDDPPVSRRDTPRDTSARNAVTSAVTPDHPRSHVTGDVTVPKRENKRTNSSTKGGSPNERADDHERPPANGEVGKWAYDGPPEAFEVNWDNPRCTLHYKMPEGMRGEPCGMCAQLSRRARQKMATTEKTGQTAAQASRNGDDRRRRMAEIARARFGDEALGITGGIPPLRAINGGGNSE